jgi:predicted esterase
MGKELAEPKVEAARRLWRGREFLLEYLRTDDAGARARQLEQYRAQRTDALAIDEMTQLIGFLPPPRAEEYICTDPLDFRTGPVEGRKKGVSYHVLLPPGYHHGRPYPVLFALHPGGFSAADIMGRLADQAGRNGYILVAPDWTYYDDGYSYTAEEHAAVTEVLRDLRRRFQVDSDRVFLMGVAEGANMAYDVGLSHPDLFAGVLPMSGAPYRHAERYWPNASNLPFYVVDGDLAGNIPKFNQAQFKKWVPMGYPCLYVQYKGRGLEWFGGELPMMFDWMNRKKGQFKRSRAVPDLGRLGGSLNQEMQLMRSTDNRFYWLSTNAVQKGHVIDGRTWDYRVWPATMQGRVSEGMINVNVRNVQQLTVWLSRDMIDFTRPLTVIINGRKVLLNRKVAPSVETLLEDLYERGDRQRLFWAKLDFDRP